MRLTRRMMLARSLVVGRSQLITWPQPWTPASVRPAHTVRSGAQPIAEAIDQEEFPEVLGTIAGDDTILIVTRSTEARQALTRLLLELAGEA